MTREGDMLSRSESQPDPEGHSYSLKSRQEVPLAGARPSPIRVPRRFLAAPDIQVHIAKLFNECPAFQIHRNDERMESAHRGSVVRVRANRPILSRAHKAV